MEESNTKVSKVTDDNIQSSTDEQELLKKLASLQRKAQRKQMRLFAVSLVIISIVGIGLWQGYVKYQDYAFRNQVPATIRSTVTFPIYLPKELPNGYSINTSSVSANSDVFTYYIESDKGQKLILTQQPKPGEIDTEKFGKERLLNSKELNLPIGKAYIGQVRNIQTASITTAESWIIITIPQKVDDLRIKEVVRSLKQL